MGQLIAVPFATNTLIDFGAEIIKIEPSSAGVLLRKWLLLDGTSLWWQRGNLEWAREPNIWIGPPNATPSSYRRISTPPRISSH